jgi:pimeloyl-ACP methyl ester carboxylesterase
LGTVAFHVAGSEEDPFEPRQIIAARERLAPFGVDIRTLPGGHLTTFEHPELLAAAIRQLADAKGEQPPWPEGMECGMRFA